MIRFSPEPQIASGQTAGVFVQKLRLMDDNRELGRALWTCTDPPGGVAQILEFWIDPAIRRSGHGRKLLRGVIEQARAYNGTHGDVLRRLWIGVGHKSHVIARAFLTGEGFHHISSTSGLLVDEDQLIYVRSLD